MSHRVLPPGLNLYVNAGEYREPPPMTSESSDLPPLEHTDPALMHPPPSSASSQHEPPPSVHFLEKEPTMPVYKGPDPASRIVKIKPMNKDLFFDGSNVPIEKFILRYEKAGKIDGAGPEELAKQIGGFIRGLETQEEIEEMSVHSTIAEGGIDSFGKFKVFRTKFKTITHYLVRMGYVSNVEDFRELIMESLSKNLEEVVMRQMLNKNEMKASKDRGDILPDTAVIFQYVQRQVQSTSVVERRSVWRTELAAASGSSSKAKDTGKDKAPTVPKATYDKKVDELTKQLASLTAGKMPPPHMPMNSTNAQTSAPTNVPFKKPNFKCFYCFQDTHGSNQCSLFANDKTVGLVKQEGRDYLLPNNSPIAWDTRRAIRDVVLKFDKETKEGLASSINVTSSFGQLEECEPEERASYEVDLGKQTRLGKEPEGTSEGKKAKNVKDVTMDVDVEDLLKEAASPSPAQNSLKPKAVETRVRFEETAAPEKEKPVRKTFLEKTLAKEFPGVEEETAKRMLAEGKMTLSYGEIFAILSGVTDVFKKKISNKCVPIVEGTSSSHGLVEGEEPEDIPTAHYSCPLGYIKLGINGQDSEALLNTGLMVNLIPEGLAQRLGLVVTEKPMSLKGIGGHQTGIIGIAESVEIEIGKLT
ncbi:hypothetical protein PTTG_29950 [Puccinia triticina 1-1 BBBD Race 1]|uniref:Uncharacterized protein n=1 Tax=Puccinia triticina (isolate 1-1 / race 1 (BBBD)) TaxID=630390 RepID=A0A180G0Y4_PUCT1|nr:hypothetical protein PTTG_29950 [Puccinia triticina 1-1 BBBD Race 1]